MHYLPKVKALSFALSGIFCFVYQVPMLAVSVASVKEEPQVLQKGIFDNVFRRGVCLPIVGCVDGQDVTEALLADQIREFAAENAPVTVSSTDLFPTVSSPPGAAFDPVLLDLRNAEREAIIPPGDYIIPVRVFCLQKTAGSPDGHRYLLGQFGGARQEILRAFNQAAANSRYSQAELQGVSWAIQSGMAYEDMPQDMQAIVNALIPEHRDDLDKDFVAEVEEIWEGASGILGLPSLRDFLLSNVGDVGETVVGFMNWRNGIITSGSDWRNLSNSFVIDDSSQATGDIVATPWSQLSEGVYGRFLTEGNYNDTGFLLLRITDTQTAAKVSHENAGQEKALPLIPLILGALTVYDLYDLISQLAATPEGNDSVQPLAMTPDLPAVDPGVIADGIDLAQALCSRIRPRGRLTAVLSAVCNSGNAASRIRRPGSRPATSGDVATGSGNGSRDPGNNRTPNESGNGDNNTPPNPRQPLNASVQTRHGEIAFDQSQIQHEFRHAEDFGIQGNWNNQNGQLFRDAIVEHVNNPNVQRIVGTYRNQPAIHYYNPVTRQNVFTYPDGRFWGSWRVGDNQGSHLLNGGNLRQWQKM